MMPIVTVQISVAGTDASSMITPNLISFCYKEGIGQSGGSEPMGDTIDLSFADPNAQFRKSWSVANASELHVTFQAGAITRDLGKMQIKSIHITQSKGAGTVIHLSGTSIPVSSHMRLTRKTRAWTKTDLQTIAGQVAKDNKLQLRYLPKDNPKIARADQHDHSDAHMVSKLCSEHDYLMKIKDGTLTIRDYADVESAGPVGTFICPSQMTGVGGLNGKGIQNWTFSDSLEDCYAQCQTSYKDPKVGKTVQENAIDVKLAKMGAPYFISHLNHHADEDQTTTTLQ
jgi:hypothetical protein